MSAMDEANKQKLTLLGLGLLMGVGTYTLSRRLMNKKDKSNRAQQEEKQVEPEIENKIKKKITSIHDEFLERHSQRLKELVAQRQEQFSFRFKICSLADELLEQSQVRFAKVNHIKDFFPDMKPMISPISEEAVKKSGTGGFFMPEASFLSEDQFVLQEKFYTDTLELESSLKFLRAGTRKNVYFKADDVKAAIVTCGGLCPGINVVIRSLVMSLYNDYGVKQIWGIKWGYRGFYTDFPDNWVELNPQKVECIHNLGGTILGSSRGGYDSEKMIDAIKKMGINQLYIIGGDGTHRGILDLQKALRTQNVQVSVCGVPKTIDNDIPFIDRSFGFQTACEEAVQFIDSANVESEAAEYGVGIVKLMGRYCGYIAVASSLASRDVNICLIPEVHFQLEGEDGVYEAIIQRAKLKGHCVVVIAEGAEDGLLPEERSKMREKLGIKEDVRDESGNIKSVDIGAYIKSDLAKYASDNHNVKLSIKYLDPMYAIRTVKANCDDTVLCSRLGYVAVHGIMAGYTDFSVGLVRDEPVMIPIDVLVDAGSKKMKRKDYEWQRVICSTGQSNFLSPENYEKVIEQEREQDLRRKEHILKLKYKILQKKSAPKRLQSYSNNHLE